MGIIADFGTIPISFKIKKCAVLISTSAFFGIATKSLAPRYTA
jgi:hypothetical protein